MAPVAAEALWLGREGSEVVERAVEEVLAQIEETRPERRWFRRRAHPGRGCQAFEGTHEHGQLQISLRDADRRRMDTGPMKHRLPLDELRSEADRVLEDCLRQDINEIKLLQEHLHDALGQLVYDRTGRRPMILPVIVEV